MIVSPFIIGGLFSVAGIVLLTSPDKKLKRAVFGKTGIAILCFLISIILCTWAASSSGKGTPKTIDDLVPFQKYAVVTAHETLKDTYLVLLVPSSGGKIEYYEIQSNIKLEELLKLRESHESENELTVMWFTDKEGKKTLVVEDPVKN